MFSNGFDVVTSYDYYASKSSQSNVLDVMLDKLNRGIIILTELKQQDLNAAQRQELLVKLHTNEMKLQKLRDYFTQSENKYFEEDHSPQNLIVDKEQDNEVDTLLVTDKFIQKVEDMAVVSIDKSLPYRFEFNSHQLFGSRQLQTQSAESCTVLLNDFMRASIELTIRNK